MLCVLSPAKRLDWSDRPDSMSVPAFLAEANSLARTMRNRTMKDLRTLMSLSEDLARLNRDRYRAWSETPEDTILRPAVFGFAGDTYTGLAAGSLQADDLAWAQDHLRILSGLYGVLRPLDGIQPYRLEMGTRLKTRRGETLYAFWRDLPARHLKAQADELGTDTLVNCASQEYFGAVDIRALGLRVITPAFLEEQGGVAKMISFSAKQARGAMARYIVTHRLTDPAALVEFDSGGYRHDPERSTPDGPVFIRSTPG
ncbi:peroxide stress protein YaaA [Pseudooceanicola aestuarii]|uniref:peroxide stress protein YaaA n=1 Tax=Pseudooceanicola aestuarii TaxID=2697319 RepID=UPI0013D4857C|nr:peroxide stress protein YaaA [Pseudooceanicola aestuarii]